MKKNKPMRILILSLTIILLSACGSKANVPMAESVSTEAEQAPELEADTSPSLVPPVPTEATLSTTDEQMVLSSFSQSVTADGNVLIIYGHVLDVNGGPVADAAVEIWQTDASGVYDHPNDPGTSTRDLNFQGYGTSLTDENGLFSFRTIEPERYGSRPKHIHFKVKMNGSDILTSQFYFGEELTAAQLGPNGELILLEFSDTMDENGNGHKLAFIDIMVDTGLGDGQLTLTPSQQQGPYYPVVDVAQFDNDPAHIE